MTSDQERRNTPNIFSQKTNNNNNNVDTSNLQSQKNNISNNNVDTSNLQSRIEEKDQLSSLNDRLATYIDRIRTRDNQAQRITSDHNQELNAVEEKARNMKVRVSGGAGGGEGVLFLRAPSV